jgi:endonuclease/exonuclease/phosphatase (EEP) superfamily protein YafD
MKYYSQVSKKFGLSFILIISLNLFNVVFAAVNYAQPIPSDNDVIFTFGNESQFELPKRLNVLVWNLHKGSNKTFAGDFVKLAYQKDLVLSQEMYLDSQMRQVFKIFPNYFYVTATSFFYGKNSIRTGVATFCPVEPTNVHFIRTEILEPVLNSPKMTLITQYPIQFSKKLLTVVNIHGINFVDGAAYQKEMDHLYENIKNFPKPLILAGDFNSWNNERNEILKNLTQKLNLKEAKFSPDFRLRFNKHPLDHFYFSENIKIISAKVEEFYQGSDHKPLEVILEYLP